MGKVRSIYDSESDEDEVLPAQVVRVVQVPILSANDLAAAVELASPLPPTTDNTISSSSTSHKTQTKYLKATAEKARPWKLYRSLHQCKVLCMSHCQKSI